MSHLSVETHDSKKPVLFLYSEWNDFTKILLLHYKERFNIVFASKDHLPQEYKDNGVHSIPLSVFQLFERIEDHIDYALVFLKNTSDKQYLERIIKKLSPSNTKICCVIPHDEVKRFTDVIQTFKSEENISFSILGEVFGWEIKSRPSGISNAIQTALTKHSFTLSGNDLLPVYLSSVEDAIIGLNAALFSFSSKEVLYYLFYEHPQTLISVIHILRRIEPEFAISFEENSSTLDPLPPSRDELESFIYTKTQLSGTYIRKQVGFEKSIEKMVQQGEPNDQTSYKEVTDDLPVKKQPKKKREPFISKKLILIPSLVLIFLTILFHAISIAATGYLYTKTKESLTTQDYATIARTIPQLQKTLTLLEPSVKVSSALISVFNENNSLLTSYEFAKDTANVAFLLSTELSRVKKLQTGLSKDEFESMIANLTYSYFELQRLKNEAMGKQLDPLTNESYSNLLSLSPVLPTILGYDKDKTYLLLFQNNAELRPTGGFIGSVGEITFSKGKITEFTIQDVYALDGQLTKHFEPHFIIRRNLQPHLYLRDSNFTLNFEESAKQSALIYESITTKQVDGVIALNYEVLRRVIESIGPITLSGYNQTLTGENTLNFLHDTIQSEFFPGSTQKRDVLNAVFNQITLALEKDSSLLLQLATITPSLLNEKHILFAFPEEATQKIFSANNFSSNLVDPRDQQAGEIRDVFSINEANIGGNKANALLTRSVDYSVALQKESIVSKATITLNNTKNQTDPYKSYIRLIAPYRSSLQSIIINGEEQTIIPAVTDSEIYERRGFSPSPGLEVDNVYEYGYQIFGFTVTVPAGETYVIETAYINGLLPRLAGVIDYSLYYIKQPGTSSYPLSVTVSFPENYETKETNASTFAKEFLTFTEDVITDKEFRAKLQRKPSTQ